MKPDNDLLPEIKERSFHDLLNLYVEANAGGKKEINEVLNDEEKELERDLERALKGVIEYIKGLLGH